MIRSILRLAETFSAAMDIYYIRRYIYTFSTLSWFWSSITLPSQWGHAPPNSRTRARTTDRLYKESCVKESWSFLLLILRKTGRTFLCILYCSITNAYHWTVVTVVSLPQLIILYFYILLVWMKHVYALMRLSLLPRGWLVAHLNFSKQCTS